LALVECFFTVGYSHELCTGLGPNLILIDFSHFEFSMRVAERGFAWAGAEGTVGDTAGRDTAGRLLLRLFGFEELAGLCEIEGVSVYDELVFAGVVGDLEHAFYLMAALAEGFDEKIDIYHAG
jgi:hypothetical protein